MKSCSTCKYSYITFDKGLKWDCNIGMCHGTASCPKWVPDDPHVEPETSKPPLGCSPYYVSISARICELCEAIKRHSTEKGKHNQIKLWAIEILNLNEMDRTLDRVSKEKTWVEEKDGTLKEAE